MPLLNLLLNLMTLLNEFLRHLEKFGPSRSCPGGLGRKFGRGCNAICPNLKEADVLLLHSSALSTSTDGLSLSPHACTTDTRVHHRSATPAALLAAHPARFGPLARALPFCPNLQLLPACMAEWPRTIAACMVCSPTFVSAFSLPQQSFFGSGCSPSLLFLAAISRCHLSLPSLAISRRCGFLAAGPRCWPRCNQCVLAAVLAAVLAVVLSFSLPFSLPSAQPSSMLIFNAHPQRCCPGCSSARPLVRRERVHLRARLLVRSSAASASTCELIRLRACPLTSTSAHQRRPLGAAVQQQHSSSFSNGFSNSSYSYTAAAAAASRVRCDALQ